MRTLLITVAIVLTACQGGEAPTATPRPPLPTRAPTPAVTARQVATARRGEIVFGTTQGADSCTVGHPSDTVTAIDEVYFASLLTERMDGSQPITLHVTKLGAEYLTHQEPANGTSFECYSNENSLGHLSVGRYSFELLHGRTVEAQGSLTVE